MGDRPSSHSEIQWRSNPYSSDSLFFSLSQREEMTFLSMLESEEEKDLSCSEEISYFVSLRRYLFLKDPRQKHSPS